MFPHALSYTLEISMFNGPVTTSATAASGTKMLTSPGIFL